MLKIVVLNPKGGCGKTTLATNLASYYSVWGVPTVLVDYDPQHSAMEWLKARPLGYGEIHGIAGDAEKVHYPGGTRRVVIDAPARTDHRQVNDLLRRADVVLIPVLPSAIDIRAGSRFLGELLMSKAAAGSARIGLVANRVREQTLIYSKLRKFLKAIKLPMVTTLRDSQNYIRAADSGIGIFEMAPYMVQHDLEQWRPLIEWIEKK